MFRQNLETDSFDGDARAGGGGVGGVMKNENYCYGTWEG